jgi:hypothetical protein
MNAGRQRTLLIQLRPLKAAQRISEYKRWPYRERARNAMRMGIYRFMSSNHNASSKYIKHFIYFL